MDNVKIAKALVRLARELMAENDQTTYLLSNEKGQVEEVNHAEFDRVFHNASRTAGIEGSMSKTVIYVSPEVNATNRPAPGIKGLKARIQNIVTTLMNKIAHKRIVLDAISKGEDESLGRGVNEGVYHLGATIEKGKGVYNSDAGDMYVEASYVVTIFGATNDESERIAKNLRDAFRQESVIVEFNPSVTSDFV